MHFSTTLVLAAVVVGESMAGPVHAHRHAHAHAKKDVNWEKLDWNNMGIDWKSAYAAGQAKTSSTSSVAVPTASPIIAAQVKKPVASTSEASVAAVATASTDAAVKASTDKVSSSIKTLFSSIKGMADDIKAFGEVTAAYGEIIDKVGNIGKPEGSNMLKVSAVGDHKYTNTFVNTATKPMTIVVWNKAATDKSGNVQSNLGSCIASTSPALSITLAPGESQVVAFQENTQAGWGEATADVSVSGAYATTWGEINYISTGCGYDVSSIMNVHGNTYDMAISAKETTCISDMTQNLWIGRNNNPEDPIPIGSSDGSCFITAGKCTITTKMGGQQ